MPKTKNRAVEDRVLYYLSLPYPVEITPISEVDGGGFTACIPLLGRWTAVGDGETPEEAYANLRSHLPSLIGHFIADGVEIPEPQEVQEEKLLSGKLNLRVPKTLHAHAVQIASREGVSLNTFLVAAIAQAVGSKSAA